MTVTRNSAVRAGRGDDQPMRVSLRHAAHPRLSVDRGSKASRSTPSSASSNHVATTAYLVGQYVGALRARRCSPETIRIVRSILTGCLSQRLGRRLDELTYDDLLAWQTLRAGEISSRSLRTQVSYVRRFYAWAHDEGLIPSNPAHRLRPPKVSQAPPRPITETRLARAMAAGDPTMRAILGLAAFAGLRACEIARLTWSDCYLDEDEPVLRVLGKGDREGIVDVSDELRELILALPGPRRGRCSVDATGSPGTTRRTGSASSRTSSFTSTTSRTPCTRCGTGSSLKSPGSGGFTGRGTLPATRTSRRRRSTRRCCGARSGLLSSRSAGFCRPPAEPGTTNEAPTLPAARGVGASFASPEHLRPVPRAHEGTRPTVRDGPPPGQRRHASTPTRRAGSRGGRRRPSGCT
jgi:hypothetical protein